MDKTHIATTIIFALFRVTASLYLNPNNKARSLSTLIAVTVTKDAKHSITPEIKAVRPV